MAIHLRKLYRDIVKSNLEAVRLASLVTTMIPLRSESDEANQSHLQGYIQKLEKEGSSRIRMFVVILLAYILCWGPLFTVILVKPGKNLPSLSLSLYWSASLTSHGISVRIPFPDLLTGPETLSNSCERERMESTTNHTESHVCMQWILNQVVKDYIPFHRKLHPTKEWFFLLPPQESGINMRIMQSSCYRHLLTSLMEEQPLLFIQTAAAWLLIINMTALIWRCFLRSWKHIIIRFSSSLTHSLSECSFHPPLHHHLLILMDFAS